MKTSFKIYLDSRVAMSVSQYLTTYLSESDREGFINVIKIYVYLDGAYITLQSDGKYNVLIDRSDYDFDNLEEAERFLWDEFLKDEVNAVHPMEDLNVSEDFSFIDTALDEIKRKLYIKQLSDKEVALWEMAVKNIRNEVDKLEERMKHY